MKLSTACVVLAAVAAAGTPAQANPLVATTVTFIGEVFTRLIKTQSLIKDVEKRNYEVLSPALNNITRELHQGLDSDIFKIGNDIHNTLVDVNLKIGQISGNASSILSQIENVAHAIRTLNFQSARMDYNIKRNRIKKLCDDTLAMTSVVLRLIDETKEMLGKGVNGPLRMLQLTIQLNSDDRLTRERANIQLQQNIIDNPPSTWLFWTDYEAVEVAESLKRVGETTVNRIENLVSSILNHAKWLEGVCQTIRDELDKERTDISKIDGKIKGTRETVNVITEEFDAQNMSDEDLREGSKSLVEVMNNLRNEVFNITRNRMRRAAEPNFYTATEPYQSMTEHASLATFQDQPRPSWLYKKSDNGCFYIYNHRTTGCISVETFDYMKEQYDSLSKNILDFEASFKAYEKAWDNLKTQVLRVSKNSLNQREVTKFVGDLETNKLMWSDDIKKLRDLSVTLNSYAESLFSEANAQLKIQGSNDVTLNEGIMREVADNKKTATEIINKNVNDILILNNLVADILSRLSINDRCSDVFTQSPPGGYPNFADHNPTMRPLQPTTASYGQPNYYYSMPQQGPSSQSPVVQNKKRQWTNFGL